MRSGDSIEDLNALRVHWDDKPRHDPEEHRALPISSGSVTALFDGLEERLIEEISHCDLVIGCVAWLTNPRILEALRYVPCAIVVQKEDMWRPDVGADSWHKRRLMDAYAALGCSYSRYSMPGVVSELSVCSDPSMHPVRCLGNLNSDRHTTRPRAHHKFVVFCDSDTHANDDGYDECSVLPRAVWTGSFNFTVNATRSLENAVLIQDTAIAGAYAREWARAYALSEPLDFCSEWVQPEYRVGT